MTQLQIELELCKNNFLFFVCYCFENFFGRKFNIYWFHKRIAELLLTSPVHNRMIINAPPRIGKTELVKMYIAWLFLRNPSSSVLYVSYDERLVARKNREIKSLLEWLSRHFGIPDLKPLRQANGKTEWVNRANGTILARGSGNAITGAGCSTLLVLDDPNKPADRTSPVILEGRNKTFTSTIRNRIDRPDTPIIIIQQRVAVNDLSGFLLEGGSGDDWEHFNFPAINEDGTALCPEMLPLEEIEKYKSDPFTYNAQYLQVPLDDIGNFFDRTQLQLAGSRPPVQAMRLVISVDAGLKPKSTNDFNAIAVIGNAGPEFYILDILNFRADITVLMQKVRDMRQKWGQNVPVLFESKANGVGAVQILRKEMKGILETTPCRNKLERAIVVKYLFDSLNVHFVMRGLVWGEVQAQFTQFPHCKHDDIVDAVVQGITWLNQLPKQGQTSTTTPQKKEIHRPVFTGRRQYARSGYYQTSRR